MNYLILLIVLLAVELIGLFFAIPKGDVDIDKKEAMTLVSFIICAWIFLTFLGICFFSIKNIIN